MPREGLAKAPQSQRERVAELQAQQEFCSTRQAADILGLAPGTVQKMVEKGTLEAWRTEGGHRRISVASLAQLLDGHATRPTAITKPVGEMTLDILVAGQSRSDTQPVSQRIAEWGLPVTVREAHHALEAGVMIGQRPPHIAILVESLPDCSAASFFEHAAHLDRTQDCDFVLLTADQQELAANMLAKGLIAASFDRPDPFSELRAFAQARFGQLIREARRRATERS